MIRNETNFPPRFQIVSIASEATLFEAAIWSIGRNRRYATLMVKYAKQTIKIPITNALGTTFAAFFTSAATNVAC